MSDINLHDLLRKIDISADWVGLREVKESTTYRVIRDGNPQANFRDFILDGVSGLTNQTVYDDSTVSGDLDVWANAVQMGNAEYGAGFYLSETQALQALMAVMKYPGFEKGYSFISKPDDRPEQIDFEPEGIDAVNGYNCNDFAFYMLL